ncbi:hypothetical protein MIMGU_mgv1a011775mg [Erythranthe guttata]|uniref:Cystatin domain-containing protein n=1 Tax=Erythranthe guttata TaxID=4155 RepID=A0A022QES7_ERYGU|nr:PREDICTED: uncharacterized protein LOC105971871 [Erythranthe guttata]EYU25000.1 hypothetical protein MIMGU_mgv1a011775mg [Erythranthe guttata]|eukprot:XP_012852245.1 PREDICTED: uncharacterized protein LOC105971871 [Erythranthe guttata]
MAMASCEFGDVVASCVGVGELGDVERNRPVGVGGAVWYDGDPASCHVPSHLKLLVEYAETAVDVYNKTHLKKYCFVELLFATISMYAGGTSDIIFTVKPEPEEEEDAVDKKTRTVRARVSVTCHYVYAVGFEFVPGDDWKAFHMHNPFCIEKLENNSTKNIPAKKSLDCSVLYDGDSTHCDEKSMNVLRECATLAIDVYNKTHEIKYNLLDMVNASGDLSTCSMVDLMFTAMAVHQIDEDDKYPKTFTTRVSITDNYVEFVELVPPEAHLL